MNLSKEDKVVAIWLSLILVLAACLIWLGQDWTVTKTETYKQAEINWQKIAQEQQAEMFLKDQEIQDLESRLSGAQRQSRENLEAYLQAMKDKRWWMEKVFQLEEEKRERRKETKGVPIGTGWGTVTTVTSSPTKGVSK